MKIKIKKVIYNGIELNDIECKIDDEVVANRILSVLNTMHINEEKELIKDDGDRLDVILYEKNKHRCSPNPFEFWRLKNGNIAFILYYSAQPSVRYKLSYTYVECEIDDGYYHQDKLKFLDDKNNIFAMSLDYDHFKSDIISAPFEEYIGKLNIKYIDYFIHLKNKDNKDHSLHIPQHILDNSNSTFMKG